MASFHCGSYIKNCTNRAFAIVNNITPKLRSAKFRVKTNQNFQEIAHIRIKEETKESLQENTRAAAAPRKPKKGAVSSPLKPEAMVLFFNLFGQEIHGENGVR